MQDSTSFLEALPGTIPELQNLLSSHSDLSVKIFRMVRGLRREGAEATLKFAFPDRRDTLRFTTEDFPAELHKGLNDYATRIIGERMHIEAKLKQLERGQGQ